MLDAQPEPSEEPRALDLDDPQRRAGVIALLGMLSYGQLTSFFEIAADGGRAPSTADKVHLAEVASAEFANFRRLADRLAELGADVHAEMAPFRRHLDEWHRRCHPSDWYEGLMKIYAGAAIARDFYRECADFVDPATRQLMEAVLGDSDHYDFAAEQLSRAVRDNEKLAARMALWGRRIVGEALSQAQRGAAENDAITGLLVDQGSGSGMDLAALMRMFTRITEAHTRRMEALGLSA